jgi:methyltransferase
VLTRALVCGYMAAARLLELWRSRGNIDASGPVREGEWSRRTFPLVVALHAGVIGGTFLLGGERVRRPWLALLVLVQPLRAWVLATLGRRWNARAAVPVAMEVAAEGPYAFVRHPNYAIVAVELFCLPAAFGLWPLAAVASAANAVLLAPRIREEEALLAQLSGYSERFDGKKRFVPGLV